MNDRRLVAFLSGGQAFAVPIGEVVEVIDAVGVEGVPGGIAPLEGLMVHRQNQVLPIFSLPRARQSVTSDAGRLIMVVRTSAGHVGFRLERVLGVLPLPEDGPEALPPDAPQAFISIARGGLPYKGGSLVVIDAAKAMAPTSSHGGNA